MKQQLGQFKEFFYIQNAESGYYEKQPTQVPFQKLPFELKMELSQEPYLKNLGAESLLRSRTANGKKKFHTGLIPLPENDCFEGDFVEFVKGKKTKSLIIFWFVTPAEIRVFFFNRYYIDKKETRELRCNQFIRLIKGA
jgi:hypothetical protein